MICSIVGKAVCLLALISVIGCGSTEERLSNRRAEADGVGLAEKAVGDAADSSKLHDACIAPCEAGETCIAPCEVGETPGLQADGEAVQPGPITCCLPEEGTACCAEAEPGTCFAYGDGINRCRELGEQVGGKAICPADCCDGLTWAPNSKPGPNGCDEGPIGPSICLLCGDGICGNFENYCNCPQDCPP